MHAARRACVPSHYYYFHTSGGGAYSHSLDLSQAVWGVCRDLNSTLRLNDFDTIGSLQEEKKGREKDVASIKELAVESWVRQ